MAGNLFRKARNYLTGETLSSSAEKRPKILPESVRMALAYNETNLSRPHIESLLENGFERLAFYLLMKAAEDSTPTQTGLIHQFAKLGYDFGSFTVEHASRALDHLDSKPEPTVWGTKLAQVSRHGFDEWVELFDKTIADKLEDRPEATLFMLANSPYIGFDVIAARSLMRGRPLGILRPEQFIGITEPDRPVGYLLNPAIYGVEIAELRPGFERPQEVVIFDDVIKTGGLRAETRGFWTADGVSGPPDFISAMKVTQQDTV